MIDQVKFRRIRRHRGVIRFLVGVLLGSATILWAWNSIAVELFQAPVIQFKHALAFQAVVAAMTVLTTATARQFRRARWAAIR
jgi:hypothetical protein